MLPASLGLVLFLAGAAAVVFICLRHIGLSMLVVLSPLPGLAAATAVAGLFGPITVSALPLAWLFAVVAGLILVDVFVRSVLDSRDRKSAMCAAFVLRAPTLALATAAPLVVLIALDLAGWQDGSSAMAAGIFGGMVSMFAGTWLAVLLPFDEDFVARSNRAHECWQRIVDPLVDLACPRWGFAVAGIALIFAVLGFFGAGGLRLAVNLRRSALPLMLLDAGVATAVVTAVLRDWRSAAATLAVLLTAILVGLSWLARLTPPLDVASFVEIYLAAGAAMLPLLSAAAESIANGRQGNGAGEAAARMLADRGAGVMLAAASLVVGLALWAVVAGGIGLALAAMAAFAGVGALAFQPALTIVLEAWIPRRTTIAARYRVE